MTTKTTPLIFFGNERLATGVTTQTPTLRALIENGYNVVAVVSNYVAGQSRNARELEIAKIANKHGIPLHLPTKLDPDFISLLRTYNASAAVLVAYGKIIPQSVIDMFPSGIINIHPSLLPLHRGPTPIESIILSGEEKTGVSLMKLAKEMDAGPVYGQSELKLTTDETKQELADKLTEIGRSMLIELLPGVLDGSIVALPQDESRATYDKMISKADGLIDWDKSAVQIEREVRAYLNWPKSQTRVGDKDVIITKVSILREEKSGSDPGHFNLDKTTKTITVNTGDGALLIERLKPAGKREMSAEEFLAGY